jgi:hypothetical protein
MARESCFIISLILFVCVFLGCNKNINQLGNKAQISITNGVQGGPPLLFYYDNVPLLSGIPLPADSTTGSPGNPYLPVVAGIHDFRATPDASGSYLQGNIGVQANLHYSIFLYDSVNNGNIRALVLQDNLIQLADTLSGIRFLNISPDTSALGVVMIEGMDTVNLGYIPFLGPNPQPSVLSPFFRIRSGTYGLTIGIDSADFKHLDSLYLAPTKLYTIFTQGYYRSQGADSLKTALVRHN